MATPQLGHIIGFKNDEEKNRQELGEYDYY